jgi:hypothetical protein
VPKIPKKSPTKVEPFNLTKPKRKEIPEPIRIPLHVKAHTVPDLNGTNLRMLMDESNRRRKDILDKTITKYKTDPVQPFVLGVCRV